MNNDDFSSDRPKRTFVEDRPEFDFGQYEAEPVNYPSVNRQFPQNRELYEKYNREQNLAADEKHLNQLALGFKIYAALTALVSCIPFMHLFLGIMVVTGGLNGGGDAPPPFVGWLFIVMAVIFIAAGWTLAACNFFAGRSLKEHRNYTFCFAMSCVNCTFMPIGTVLGVFGIMVLVRDSVKKLFAEKDASVF